MLKNKHGLEILGCNPHRRSVSQERRERQRRLDAISAKMLSEQNRRSQRKPQMQRLRAATDNPLPAIERL